MQPQQPQPTQLPPDPSLQPPQAAATPPLEQPAVAYQPPAQPAVAPIAQPEPPVQQVPAPEMQYQQPAEAAVQGAALPVAPVADIASIPTTVVPPEAGVPINLEGDEELARWQATEYIHRDKNMLWYVGLGVVVVLLEVAAWFLMGQSISFMILIPIMAAALVIYTSRPPALLSYTLSRKGLHVNDKLHHFDDYKEFGLIQDDEENAVLLVPRKRFQPGVTVYFPEEVGEAVVDMLAARLPMREARLDPVDRLTRFLRI